MYSRDKERGRSDGNNNNTKSENGNDEALYFDNTNELKFTKVEYMIFRHPVRRLLRKGLLLGQRDLEEQERQEVLGDQEDRAM